MKTPKFWYREKSWQAKLLSPIGKIYGWSVARRFKKERPYQAKIPVICVGNLSIGGTGKTPICLALGKMLKEMDAHFFFLNHGYKSKKKGILVRKGSLSALDIGDEASLLATEAPTVVDPRRARGAQLAERKGAKLLIMDDGFQNPSLIKTFSFIVVDGQVGFGNQALIPAGPLRESLERGLARADAVIIAGPDRAGVKKQIHKISSDMPVYGGHFQPDSKVIQKLRGKKVMAFAGIGRPDKFFDMLTDMGVFVDKKAVFPDHYDYTRFDIENLLSEAGSLPLVTTTKDAVKVPKDIQNRLIVVPGQFVFDNPETIQNVLKGIMGV